MLCHALEAHLTPRSRCTLELRSNLKGQLMIFFLFFAKKNFPLKIFHLFLNLNGFDDMPVGCFPVASHCNDNRKLGVFKTKTCCYGLREMAVVQRVHIIQMNCYINHRMCQSHRVLVLRKIYNDDFKT